MLRSSIHIGTVFGIPIGINYSWIIIFALVTLSLSGSRFPSLYPEWPEWQYWALGVAASLLFFISVLIHELAHSVVSTAQGVPVKSITLFIFGGVSNISAEPKKAIDEFLMAAAGPASSLILAFLFWTFSLVTVLFFPPLAALGRWLAGINFTLAIFNLIPGFPLDGGRVFRSIVWGLTGNVSTATRVAAILGQVVAYLFIFVGIFMVIRGNLDGLWLALIGWFLESAASQSYRQVALRDALRGVKAGDLVSRDCAYVPDNLSVEQFVHDYVLPQSRRCFLITNQGNLSGLATIHNIRAVHKSEWDHTSLKDVMTPVDQVKRVQITDDAVSVLELMDQEDVNQVPVMDGNQLVGMIGRDAMLRFIRTRAELGM